MSQARIKALIAIIILTSLAAVSLINHARNGNLKAGIIISASLVAVSFIAWWIFLKYDDNLHRKRIKHSMLVATIIGGTSFIIGFVGPMIFTPKANQGPLLGILFTGPVGFLLGFILGIFSSFKKYPSENLANNILKDTGTSAPDPQD